MGRVQLRRRWPANFHSNNVGARRVSPGAAAYHRVECIVGHDFGCVPASLAALSRPDIFA